MKIKVKNPVFGVPITFLDKHCPGQFKIVGATESEGKGFSGDLFDKNSKITQPLVGGGGSINVSSSSLKIPGMKKYDRPFVNGTRLYFRLLIQRTEK